MSLENLKKLQERIENDPALKEEIIAATKDAKSREDAVDATLPIAERIGLPFTKNDVKKFFMLDDETLDEVAGGGWGYHIYRSESVYNACGIQTDWTGWYNPFMRDTFVWEGHEDLKHFDKNDAAAVVFYHHVNGKPPKDLNQAYSFKTKNLALFEKDIAAANSKG